MHFPAGELGQLQERRAPVEQARDPLAWQELAALLELLRLLRGMSGDGVFQRPQFVHQRLHVSGVGFERLRVRQKARG